jgi:hypothetical protein
MLYFFFIFFIMFQGFIIYQMKVRSPDPTNILCLIKEWLLKAAYQEEEQVRIVTIWEKRLLPNLSSTCNLLKKIYALSC